MALTFDALVDYVRSVAPEVTQTQATTFVNDRTGRMVAEAEWRTKTAALTATTVAGQAVYDLDTDTVDLRTIFIGTDKYARSSYEEINEVLAGRADVDTRDGKTGLFAPYSADGSTASIYVYPAPSTTGDSITAIEALYPADSTYGGTDNLSPIVPKQIRPFIRDGALADAYEVTGRWDEAQNHEQRYEAGIEKLRRLKNTRVGSGPGRITLVPTGGY